MKKKLICGALFGALALAQSAVAQDFDDRWYVGVTGGVYDPDSRRDKDNNFFGGLSVGKFFNDNLSLDLELQHADPEGSDGLSWKLENIGLMGRYHFVQDGRNWAPYLGLGLGSMRHREEISGFPMVDREGNNLSLKGALGLQADMGRYGVRLEGGAIADLDDSSFAGPGTDSFLDAYMAASLLVALGAEAAEEAPTPAPAAPDCSSQDDDNDGVNNCNDRCPGSAAGQAVGPDGCPVQIAIDLKGVNFDFNKNALRSDAIAILNEAADILKRYPQLRVEVAGHTDLCGNEGYNQRLSQSRAEVVYKYLADNGVDASRMSGPNGYGEGRPLQATEQTSPACRSETNRRTELNVQN